MEDKLYQGKNINEICLKAAEGCYYPNDNEKMKCMTWIIELLVDEELDCEEGYTIKKLTNILKKKTLDAYNKSLKESNNENK